MLRGNVLVWPCVIAVAIWKPVETVVDPSDAASASVPRPFIDRRALSVASREFA